MKIAIIGYGKMGKTIEKIATKEKIEIACIIDKDLQKGDLSEADVSINFCVPSAVVKILLNLLTAEYQLYVELPAGLKILIW